MKSDNVVITFIKNPELGKVKTRLAKTMGNDQALVIYNRLMKHTRQVVSNISATRLLFYSEWINRNDDWSDKLFDKHLQNNGDLGQRITAAFIEGFSHGKKVIIVGSDCPGLSKDIIEKAFSNLQDNDFVIGPALDGGYYLLGMNEFHPEIFQNIHWSTDQVKNQTTDIIKSLGKSMMELEPLSDIDYEEDWKIHGGQLDLND